MAYPISEASAFNASKQAILNLMRDRHCADVGYVDDLAQSFSDLVPLLFEFAKTFDCDPAYLVTLLGQIPADVLIAQHVYLSPAIVGSVENPALVVGGDIENVVLQGSGGFSYHPGLEVHNNANISKIRVQGNIRVKNITIASGSQVDELEIEPGSVVESIHVKCCGEDNCGKLLKVYSDDQIESLTIDGFAQFGGVFCKPQTLLP